jgi:hypothetical protein
LGTGSGLCQSSYFEEKRPARESKKHKFEGSAKGEVMKVSNIVKRAGVASIAVLALALSCAAADKTVTEIDRSTVAAPSAVESSTTTTESGGALGGSSTTTNTTVESAGPPTEVDKTVVKEKKKSHHLIHLPGVSIF